MKDGIELQNNSITTSVTHTGSAAVFQSTYSISNISSSDIGTYTCTVTNPIGSDSLDIVVDAIVGKQVSVLLYSLDAYSHVLMHICDLILENRRYTYNGTFVIKCIQKQWVKNASFRKKNMQVFIALLVGELTLLWINPGHHRVSLFIGS